MSALSDIIAREQARVQQAAEAVIAQRQAAIDRYTAPKPAPVVSGGLPPLVTHADVFPAIIPDDLPAAIVLPAPVAANDIPLGVALVPDEPGYEAPKFLLPPPPISPLDDDWTTPDVSSIAPLTDASDARTDAQEFSQGASQAGGEFGEEWQAQKPKGKARKKSRAKKAKGKARKKPVAKKPKPKARKKAAKKGKGKKRTVRNRASWENPS